MSLSTLPHCTVAYRVHPKSLLCQSRTQMEMGNLYPAEETAAVELHFGEQVEITGGGKTRLGYRAQDLE